MRPLGLDAVGLSNLLEKMFNNEPAVRHTSPNDPPGKTLTNVLLNDAALTLMDRGDIAAGMMDQVIGQARAQAQSRKWSDQQQLPIAQQQIQRPQPAVQPFQQQVSRPQGFKMQASQTKDTLTNNKEDWSNK